MIRRDLDACILQATTFDSFLELLAGKGYDIKQGGKYLAIKPQGMTRFKRCKTLGADYTEERIRERILTETLASDNLSNKRIAPHIVGFKVKRFRRARNTKLQKKYYARLYRVGILKKRPYSQVWKYRDEIRKMEKLQNQYLFLRRYDVESMEELSVIGENLTERKKELSREKSRAFKARAKCQTLFDIVAQMEELKEAEKSYVMGDTFFRSEYEKYHSLAEQLQKEGYQYEEVMVLKEHYRNEISKIKEKEIILAKELSTVKIIIKELLEEQWKQQKQFKGSEQIRETEGTHAGKKIHTAKMVQETKNVTVTKDMQGTQLINEGKNERQPNRSI
jgi:hypothetical protein